MPTAVGASPVSSYRLGANLADRLYLGTTVLWQAVSYRYYRLRPIALRDAVAANSIALSEFALLNGSARLTGMTASSPGADSPLGEDATKAADNDVVTKWLDFRKEAATLVYDFAAATKATGYRWATSNDSPERDPVSWAVDGSADAVTWVQLDGKSSFAVTTARSTFLPDFPFLTA